jgi:hypothetical protein
MSKENKKLYDQKYRENNKAKIKAYHKSYYQKNAEKLKAAAKLFREKNPEKTVAYNLKYKDKRRVADYQRYWNNRDKEIQRMKAYSVTPKGKFSEYKTNAKTRSLIFSLTFEQFMVFWQKSCTYCGNAIETIGIDRIDNTRGYEFDNCTSCCIICQRMKMDHPLTSWLNHMQKVLKHLELQRS